MGGKVFAVWVQKDHVLKIGNACRPWLRNQFHFKTFPRNYRSWFMHFTRILWTRKYRREILCKLTAFPRYSTRIRWGQDVMTRIPMMAEATMINADHLRDGGGEISIPGLFLSFFIFKENCGDYCSPFHGIYSLQWINWRPRQFNYRIFTSVRLGSNSKGRPDCPCFWMGGAVHCRLTNRVPLTLSSCNLLGHLNASRVV